jgi:hypothetical protein
MMIDRTGEKDNNKKTDEGFTWEILQYQFQLGMHSNDYEFQIVNMEMQK